MAADEDDAERSLRVLLESVRAIAPALQESSNHAATIQSLLSKPMNKLFARSIESLLTSIEGQVQGAASQLTSAGDAVTELKAARAHLESQASNLAEERETLQAEYQEKCQTLETEQEKLENLKEHCKNTWETKHKILEQQQESLRIAKAQCTFDHTEVNKDKARIVYNLQSTSSRHMLATQLMDSAQKYVSALQVAEGKAKAETNVMSESRKSMTDTTTQLSKSNTSMTKATFKMSTSADAMVQTSTKMSESTAAMTNATNEFKAFRLQSQHTILQKDAEIARLKAELEATRDTARNDRAVLVDAHQRQLARTREKQAAAEGAYRELRRNHDQGIQHAARRMFDGFDRFAGDALAAEQSRVGLRALLQNLNNSANGLQNLPQSFQNSLTGLQTLHGGLNTSVNDFKASLGGMQTSHGDLKTSVNNFKTSLDGMNNLQGDFKTSASDFKTSASDFKTSASDFKTSLVEMNTLQGEFKTSVNNFKTSVSGMNTLSDTVKDSLSKFTKHQDTILANDHELQASITAMDAARWEMVELRQDHHSAKQKCEAKSERYEDLTFELYGAREELDIDTYNLADVRKKLEADRRDLLDESRVIHSMVDSPGPEDTVRPSHAKRRQEEVRSRSPKRQRFEPSLLDEESRDMADDTLVETAPLPTEDEAIAFDEDELQMPGDEDVVVDTPHVPVPAHSLASPEINPETAPEVAVDTALDTLSEPVEIAASRAVTPSLSPIPAAPAAAPQPDAIDQIFGLFDTPAGWTQAKRDELMAHLREKYHGKSFEDIQAIMDKALRPHPRFDVALKCLLFQGYKDGKSCVPKGMTNTRANCPRHGSKTEGLCLIISKAQDASPCQWVLTDRD